MGAVIGFRACSHCRFFVRTSKDLSKPGECRKNPPMAMSVMTNQGTATMGAFPPVKSNLWCGAWESAHALNGEQRTDTVIESVD